MAFTPAQKRQYWAKKNADDKKRAANRKPFVPLANPSPLQLTVFDDVANETHDTVIEACAGSGKSTTLLNALLYIPEGKKIAFCAFGRDPADELKDRCPRKGVDIATTHSFGRKAVVRRFHQAALDTDKLKKIIIGEIGDPYADTENTNVDLEEKLEAFRKCVELAKQTLSHDIDSIIDIMDKYDIEFLTGEEQKRVSSDIELHESLQTAFAANCVKLLDKCKNQTYTYDLTDMIWLPVVLNLHMDQYDVIMPDEVQDFNACQIALIKMMRKATGRIIATGDRKQAIFLFRSADENSIPNLISALNAKVLPLSITYRCSKAVVTYVKSIVEGLTIEAGPNNAEGKVNLDVTFDTLKENAKPGDFIISRLNAPLMPIALHMIRHNIPCQIKGKNIGEYLKYYIWKSKAKTIPEFVNWIDEWEQEQMEFLQKRKRKPSNMEALVENIRDKSGCLTMLALDCKTIKELNNRINSLFSDDGVSKDNPKFILLTNTHKIKGNETDTVWMLDSTFKHGKSIEESNLIYVAATRARVTLNVVKGSFRDGQK